MQMGRGCCVSGPGNSEFNFEHFISWFIHRFASKQNINLPGIQLLSLLLAMVLRAMVSTPTPDPDDEEDYENPRNRARDPLLGSQASAGSSKSENWSSRIRERVLDGFTVSFYFLTQAC